MGVHDDLNDKPSAFTDIIVVVSGNSFNNAHIILSEVNNEPTSDSSNKLSVLLEVGEVGKLSEDIIEMGEVTVTITEVRILKLKYTHRWC